MRNARVMVVCASVALMIVGAGCDVPPSGEEFATVTEEVQRPDPGERATEELPMRNEDLVDVAAIVGVPVFETCPSPTTCPSSFGSCAAWSTTRSCGSSCGTDCVVCSAPPNPSCFNGIKRSTFTTQFRVCFNTQGQSCTEFQVFTATACQLTGDCCDLQPGRCGA